MTSIETAGEGKLPTFYPRPDVQCSTMPLCAASQRESVKKHGISAVQSNNGLTYGKARSVNFRSPKKFPCNHDKDIPISLHCRVQSHSFTVECRCDTSVAIPTQFNWCACRQFVVQMFSLDSDETMLRRLICCCMPLVEGETVPGHA